MILILKNKLMQKTERLIKSYNEWETVPASDYLLDLHFGNLNESISPHKISSLIVLLDGIWQTQLYRNGDAAEKISKSIKKKHNLIQTALISLPEDALQNHPEEVFKAAQEIFPIILRIRGLKQHYSFASKYSHWCTRCHFPIVDANARKAINALQRRYGITSDRIPASAANGWQSDYKKWVYFYSDLLNSLTTEEKQKLIKIDKITQPKNYYIKNSLLRILDKIFYTWGQNLET